MGALADKIHTGRSRNEQVSLDVRLWLREQIDVDLELLVGVMHALVEMARKYPHAIVPGYTHLRRAQAVPWAHYLLAYFEMFARDHERLSQARARVDVMPLGSGALAGSGFPFDREQIARDLGFAAITRNSMDVSGDRDFALDFLYAASVTMLHLSRLAEDWILYSSEEFGWLELGDGVTSGSSLMPQKKNPDSLELIRGKSGRVFGDFTSLFVTMKGLPMTYNRDMQEDKEPLFDAAAQLTRGARNDGGGDRIHAPASERVRSKRPKRAGWWPPIWPRLWRAPERRFIARIRLWANWCSRASSKANNRSIGPPSSSPRSRPSSQPTWRACCDPAEGMKTRELPGGTGPAAVAQALDEAEASPATVGNHEQSFPPRPDPEADPRQADPDAGRPGARAEGEPRASRPRRSRCRATSANWAC